MERISAAGNLTIEMLPGQWRLMTENGEQTHTIVEALTGQPLSYTDLFASKRRLPDDGKLPTQFIQQVVLGWSNEDEAWHLGLVFDPELSRMRGSRWCELARWPDPDTTVFHAMADQAGRTLAMALARPYNLLQPEIKPKTAPPPPLPDLPLRFDHWQLETIEDEAARKNRLAAELGRAKPLPPTLQLRRIGSWTRGKALRVIWYLLLAGIYLGLSVLSLQGTLALPTPDFLPYIGLGAGVFFILFAFAQAITILFTPNNILISADSSSVAIRHGDSERERIEMNQIEAVYASQVLNKRGHKYTLRHSELNLLLRDGTFHALLEQPQPGYQEPLMLETDLEEAVTPLTQANSITTLQAAALYIARTLNVPSYDDLRLK
ncbi:MAG: hypothetical protein H6672_20760 [Anaerolineaceae bacterium]|nr:hypothetical protein [Anaerolineaceae bacterium]